MVAWGNHPKPLHSVDYFVSRPPAWLLYSELGPMPSRRQLRKMAWIYFQLGYYWKSLRVKQPWPGLIGLIVLTLSANLTKWSQKDDLALAGRFQPAPYKCCHPTLPWPSRTRGLQAHLAFHAAGSYQNRSTFSPFSSMVLYWSSAFSCFRWDMEHLTSDKGLMAMFRNLTGILPMKWYFANKNCQTKNHHWIKMFFKCKRGHSRTSLLLL